MERRLVWLVASLHNCVWFVSLTVSRFKVGVVEIFEVQWRALPLLLAQAVFTLEALYQSARLPDRAVGGVSRNYFISVGDWGKNYVSNISKYYILWTRFKFV